MLLGRFLDNRTLHVRRLKLRQRALTSAAVGVWWWQGCRGGTGVVMAWAWWWQECDCSRGEVVAGV